MDGGLDVGHVGVLRPDVVKIAVLDEMRLCVENGNVLHATLEVKSHEEVRPFAIPDGTTRRAAVMVVAINVAEF